MRFVIGIDVGTSGTKCALYSEEGFLVSSHTENYDMYQPNSGWAEQNPEDWWKATVVGIIKIIRDSCEKLGIDRSEVCKSIAGIGLTGQMHSLVLLDEDDKVIRNAILWCDQRSERECIELTDLVGEETLMKINRNPAITGFTASKILWVKNNELDNFKRIKTILLPKDYIRFMMTGVKATDASDAAGMQLLDLEKRDWSDFILDKVGIDRTMLGTVHESNQVTGYTNRDFYHLTGIKSVPVVAGGGDNACSAIGCGVVQDGSTFASLGTSGVVYTHNSVLPSNAQRGIHTFCSAVPGEYHLMGVHQASGLSLKWFVNNFCEKEKEMAESSGRSVYELTDEIVKSVPIGSNNLLYLPYLMGERTPHLDPDIRGAFIGLSAMHTKGDLLRAVMEGVVFSLRDSITLFNESGITIDKVIACGGGSNSPVWRQMIADVFDCEVYLSNSSDMATFGAAILAMNGVGIHSDLIGLCRKFITYKLVNEPIEDNHINYNRIYNVFAQIYDHVKAINKQLQINIVTKPD